MSAFEQAWMHNCPIHKKERMFFYQKCWKCEILKYATSFREIKLMLIAKTQKQ